MIPAQRVQVPVCMCHLATQHSSNSFVLLPAGGLLVQRGGRGHRDPAQPLQGGHPPDDGGDAAGAHLACPAAGAAQGCTPLAGRGGAGSARSRGSPPEVTDGQLGFRELCLYVVNSASPGSVQGAGGCKSRRSHGEMTLMRHAHCIQGLAAQHMQNSHCPVWYHKSQICCCHEAAGMSRPLGKGA